MEKFTNRKIKGVPEGISDEELLIYVSSCIDQYYQRQIQPSQKKIDSIQKKCDDFRKKNT